MNSKQRAKVERAVRRLVKAEVADSWKGGGDPDHIPGIEKELHLAKQGLKTALDAAQAAASAGSPWESKW